MGKAGFGMASQMDLHRFLLLAEQVSFQSRIRASTNFRNYGMEKNGQGPGLRATFRLIWPTPRDLPTKRLHK